MEHVVADSLRGGDRHVVPSGIAPTHDQLLSSVAVSGAVAPVTRDDLLLRRIERERVVESVTGARRGLRENDAEKQQAQVNGRLGRRFGGCCRRIDRWNFCELQFLGDLGIDVAKDVIARAEDFP